MSYNRDLLLAEADKLNLDIPDDSLQLFEIYARLLTEKNKVMNLTAVTDRDGIAVKHFADSISILSSVDIQSEASVIDIGTGAGFPGIPLLIMRRDIRLTLVDSTAKKIDFVSDVLKELGLSANTVPGRAEELSHIEEYREKYDFCVSRAVASLNILCELCIPFLKTGGLFIAMKGSKADEEIFESEITLKKLNSEIINTNEIRLGDGFNRKLILKQGRQIKNIPVNTVRYLKNFYKGAVAFKRITNRQRLFKACGFLTLTASRFLLFI